MKHLGFFDLLDHLKRLLDAGDPLLELDKIVDFEGFRPILDIALNYSDGSKGRRTTLLCCGNVQTADFGGT